MTTKETLLKPTLNYSMIKRAFKINKSFKNT